MADTNPPTPPESKIPSAAEALEHVTEAHQQLTSLREKLGVLNRHPELEQALIKLEMALSALSVSTGGMW